MTGPVAVGTDLIDVERIRVALARTPSLADRAFTPAELAYCNRAADPSERLAARWAAKEAVMKCLGGGVPGVDLREVEIVRAESGAPSLHLTGVPAERAAERGIGAWLISMSHTATVAQAVVIALG